MPPLFKVYVIELECGKFYVHKHPDQSSIGAIHSMACFYTPWKGVGTPAWVEKYRPLATNPPPLDPPYGSMCDESLDNLVWKLMLEKGFDNVRGGSFQAIDLTKEDIMRLRRRPIPTYAERRALEIEVELETLIRRINRSMDE